MKNITMYKIKSQNQDSTEILLYSLIEGGYTAGRLIKALQSSPSENITLRINSDGGETFEGIAIYNYLKDKNVTVIIDGMCASAASIVAMAGSRVIMRTGTMFMIHNPITFAYGDSEELKSASEMLKKVEELCVDIYERKTGLDREELADMMNAQTWMTPNEALSLGFIDEVEESPEVPAKSGEEETDGQPELLSYEEGIKAERARIQALDELYTPERVAVLNRAKYFTFQSAQDIAIDLLKSERSRKAEAGITNFPVQSKDTQIIDSMSEYINQRRGNNGR